MDLKTINHGSDSWGRAAGTSGRPHFRRSARRTPRVGSPARPAAAGCGGASGQRRRCGAPWKVPWWGAQLDG
jgi:hypothetical protein